VIRHRSASTAVIVAALAASLAGCSGSGGSGAPASTSTSTAAPAGTPGTSEATAPVLPPVAGGVACPASGVTVSSPGQLQGALANARPGQAIVLAPGVYKGDFVVSRSGTQQAPITLCGPPSAVLEGDGTSSGYTLHLDHASWWRVQGFTVQGGQKGIMTDGAGHDLLYGLYVHDTGDEAIHLRDFSSYNVVSHCKVRNAGLHKPKFGEGIYIGTANKNWDKNSQGKPDASDHNVITGNDVANTTAENVDIKEGTTGGRLTGNHFDGTGMVEYAATAWVNVKGNDWAISGNTGVSSIKDGFQVHQVYPGWGLRNTFLDNQAQVNGPGYGIYVQHDRLAAVVACNNKVSGARSGFSNQHCS
jgi:hypothetical protein